MPDGLWVSSWMLSAAHRDGQHLRRRAPLQAEQGRADMYSSMRSRWVDESVSR